MSRNLLLLCAVAVASMAAAAPTTPSFCNKLNCPTFTVVKSFAGEPNFEIRSYDTYKWASTNITGVTEQEWSKVTQTGFGRLFNVSVFVDDGVCPFWGLPTL